VQGAWQCPGVPPPHSYLPNAGPRPECYEETKNLISKHEGCMQCVYFDTDKSPKRTIGIGYCIDCDVTRAKKDFDTIKADYTAVVENKKALPSSVGYTCDCTDPKTCLTGPQITQLYSITVAKFLASAEDLVSTTTCCGVFSVIADLLFKGENLTRNWPQLLLYISQQQWEAASLVMHTCHTKFCTGAKQRCDDDTALLKTGCPCAGQACGSAACFDANHPGPCCNVMYNCTDDQANAVIKADVSCPTGYPVCCAGAGCCPTAYSNCCTDSCCASGYPVCCGGPYPAGWCCPHGAKCGNNKNCQSVTGELLEEDLHGSQSIRQMN